MVINQAKDSYSLGIWLPFQIRDKKWKTFTKYLKKFITYFEKAHWKLNGFVNNKAISLESPFRNSEGLFIKKDIDKKREIFWKENNFLRFVGVKSKDKTYRLAIKVIFRLANETISNEKAVILWESMRNIKTRTEYVFNTTNPLIEIGFLPFESIYMEDILRLIAWHDYEIKYKNQFFGLYKNNVKLLNCVNKNLRPIDLIHSLFSIEKSKINKDGQKYTFQYYDNINFHYTEITLKVENGSDEKVFVIRN